MMMQRFLSSRNLAFLAFGLAALFWAWQKINPLLFNPVNGDFQTFNPIARVLDGQFPYLDFANYLGIGPLLLTLTAALPTGPTFAGSVLTTDILVSLAFVYMMTTAFQLLGTPRPWLFAIGLYFLGRLPEYIGLLPSSGFLQSARYLFDAIANVLGLKYMTLPGHSLMPIRALWPFLAGIALLHYLRTPTLPKALLLGTALGAGVLWSNDYGPTTAVAFGIAVLVFKRNWKHLGAIVAIAIPALVIALSIVTGGHPVAWFEFNQTVAQDQFWYYYFPDNKIVSIDMIDLDWTTWSLGIILLSAVAFFQKAWRSKTPESQTFFAIYLTSVLAGVLSLVGSSWFPYYLSAPILLCVAGAIHYYAPTLLKRINIDSIFLRAPLGILAVVFLVSLAMHPRMTARDSSEAMLGAQLHRNYDEFHEMLGAVDGADGVWSTYATAAEAVLGIHHPSGHDYIIHALGNTGRKHYLETFHSESPELVITPSSEKIMWEVWSRIVNWWFYRELLHNYEPVGQGPYWTLWKRALVPHESLGKLGCTVVKMDENAVRIEVDGGPASAGRLADITLSYQATSPAFTRLLLEVEDEGLKRQYRESVRKAGFDEKKIKVQSSVGFPPNAGTWNIPVQLDENGKGFSSLHANRRSIMGAKLDVTSCIAIDWAPSGRIER